MEFFNSDFSNEMPLVGVFMCRLIRNTADQPIDLLIYRQNPAFNETYGLPGLIQGTCISFLENAGVFLPAAFWQNIDHPGVATYAFSAYGSYFKLDVFATDDNYLLNVYRKAVEPLSAKPQSVGLQPDVTELKTIQRQLLSANVSHKPISGADDSPPSNMIGPVTNATEANIAQIVLTDSEKRYRFLVNNLKEVIFQTDLQLNLLFLSPAWIELTGFDLEGTLADDPFAYIHPEDREICRQTFVELLQQTIEHSLLEIRYLTREGDYKWIEVFTKLTYDEHKRPNGTIGTLYDISERKKMEKELQEREKRFKAIFNSTFQFIALTDVEGNLLEINKTALAARGVMREEIIGKPFWAPTPGRVYKDVQQILESFRQAAQGRVVQFEMDVLDSSQQVSTIDFSISPIRDDEGRVIFLLPEGRDISEMKKARAAIVESEQRFRDIAENVDEVFWIRDLNSPRFIYINSTYERITGKTPQSLYENPMSFLNFVLAEDRQHIAGLLQTNVEEDTEMSFRVINKNGALRCFAGCIFVVKDEQGVIRRRIGLARDITSQKEKEKLLTEMLDKEKELNKMKSQFVSFVSHEFRTPLTTIQSSVELIEHYLFHAQKSKTDVEYAPKLRHHIEIIHTKIAMITDLLTDTLTLNQIEAGKISFHPQSMDLVVFLKNMMSEFFSDRPDRRIVETEISGVPVMVSLDAKLIKRALINVLSNAFKFSTDNPVLRLFFEERQIRIEVIDRGIGIPKEDIPKLFTTFFRASNAGKVPGTGLGLQIAQQLIELHGGKIHLTSQLGKGTCVYILIPLP